MPIHRTRSPNHLRCTALAICLSTTLAAIHAGQAVGNTIVVTTCGDTPNTGTLRDAVTSASDGTTIDLTQLPVGCSTITLESGAIIAAVPHLSIQGPGRDALTIDADGASGAIHAKYSLALSDLTITGGRVAYGGGCVYAGRDLAVTRTTITGCHAGDASTESSRGGAIEVLGDLAMSESIVSGSTAQAAGSSRGGGVYVGGSSTIVDSVIAANLASATSRDAQGGAIYVRSDVDIVGSILTDNDAHSIEGVAYGGAIRSLGDTVRIANGTTVSGNLARSDGERWSYGGGVAAGARYAEHATDVTIADSTISGNTASSACNGCTVIGGGVFAAGTIEAVYSAIYGNVATVDATAGGYAAGGGLATRRYGVDGKIALVNATVSGNTAHGGEQGYGFGYGGGIAAIDQSPFAFTSSTLAFNAADSFGGGAVGSGIAATLAMDSTIVANNSASMGADLATSDASVPATIDGTNNLVVDARYEIGFAAPTLADDPKLAPLAKNGGATANHALGPCSKAIDAGANPAMLRIDQRGGNHAREAGAAADIGAFERQPDDPLPQSCP